MSLLRFRPRTIAPLAAIFIVGAFFVLRTQQPVATILPQAQCDSLITLHPASEYDVPVNEAGEHYLPSVLVADVDKNGKNDVVVSRGSEGGMTVYLGKGDNTLSAGETYSGPGTAGGLTIGDFNGDGKSDIAVATSNNGYYGLIYTGNGDGTFSTSPIALGAACGGHLYTLESAVVPGAPGQILLAGADENNVYIFLSKGGGQFAAPVTYPRSAVGPWIAQSIKPLGVDFSFFNAKIVFADANKDGKLDLLSADLAGNPELRLGDGTGGFGQPAPLIQNPTQAAADFAVGDYIDHDGTDDVAVITTRSASEPVALLLRGKGDGSFTQTSTPVPLGSAGSSDPTASANQPLRAAVKDVTNDGFPDISVTSYQNSTIFVLQGFELKQAGGLSVDFVHARTHPFAIAAADMNGDGKAELVTANFAAGCTDAGSVTVYGNNMCDRAAADPQHASYEADALPLAAPAATWCASSATTNPDACGPIRVTPQCNVAVSSSSSSISSNAVSSRSASSDAASSRSAPSNAASSAAPVPAPAPGKSSSPGQGGVRPASAPQDNGVARPAGAAESSSSTDIAAATPVGAVAQAGPASASYSSVSQPRPSDVPFLEVGSYAPSSRRASSPDRTPAPDDTTGHAAAVPEESLVSGLSSAAAEMNKPGEVAAEVIQLMAQPRNPLAAALPAGNDVGAAVTAGETQPDARTQEQASRIAVSHSPAGKTGPAAVFVMAAGAASGWSWMRRRRR